MIDIKQCYFTQLKQRLLERGVHHKLITELWQVGKTTVGRQLFVDPELDWRGRSRSKFKTTR